MLVRLLPVAQHFQRLVNLVVAVAQPVLARRGIGGEVHVEGEGVGARGHTRARRRVPAREAGRVHRELEAVLSGGAGVGGPSGVLHGIYRDAQLVLLVVPHDGA